MEKFKIDFIKKVASQLNVFGIDFGVDIFIACQFALESNFGRSTLAVECNNFCGMRSPTKRITLDVYPGSEWAEYDNLQECVLDYVIWLAWNHFTLIEVQSVDDFVVHLKNSGYCPEKDYIDKIQSIYSQFKSSQNGK